MSELARPAEFVPRGHTALNEHARGLSIAWPIALIAAVLYGSLLPFDIDWSVYTPSNVFGLFAIGIPRSSREDILVNLLIYIPIGLGLVLCGRGRIGILSPRVPFAVVLGAGVSVMAEMMQTGIAMRVASWTDVALNTLGTGFGALLGAGLGGIGFALIDHVKRGLARRPFATLASTLMVCIFLYGLAPFDFITDTAGMHASFGRARWGLFGIRSTAHGDTALAQISAQLTGAAWFALLGYISALAVREPGRRDAAAVGSVIKHGFVLACLVEFMQLFTMSHRFDLVVIVLRSLAVILGTRCAASFATARADKHWQRRPGLAFPTLALAVVAAFQILAQFVSAINPNLLSFRAVDLANVHWVPFEALWRRPMTVAASEILTAFVIYGTLSVTLAVVFSRLHLVPTWLMSAGAVVFVAMSVETFQAFSASGSPDLTEPVLAGLSVVVASRLHPPALAAFSARPDATTTRQVERAVQTPSRPLPDGPIW